MRERVVQICKIDGDVYSFFCRWAVKRKITERSNKFQFIVENNTKRADEKQSSALKICIAVSKEKGSEK